MSQSTNFGDYQLGIYMQGMAGITPELPMRLEELEERARLKLDSKAYWYVAGSAGAEDTKSNNRQAFTKWEIVPRMLRDVNVRDHTVTVLNDKFAAPVMFAPVGVQEIVHSEAELAVARAAKALNLPMILSTLSSYPMEDVAEVLGDTPRWFQLYWPSDNDVTKSFLKRAEEAGYTAIVVTLDTKLMGWRERDLQEAYLPFLEGKGIANYTSDPAFRERLGTGSENDKQAAVAQWAEVYSDPGQTWDDLKFLRDNTKLPILLKGILHPEDAEQAVEAGMDGIIVSNHGGRQVDGAIGALDCLPVIDTEVGGKLTVLFDSGVRHGSDIVKALALGAKAVLIGRPYIWGLALNGQDGVHQVMQRILADYDLAMGLSGFTSPSQLGPEALARTGWELE